MINLKIDPEFQSQIPPLTDDEFKQKNSERWRMLRVYDRLTNPLKRHIK